MHEETPRRRGTAKRTKPKPSCLPPCGMPSDATTVVTPASSDFDSPSQTRSDDQMTNTIFWYSVHMTLSLRALNYEAARVLLLTGEQLVHELVVLERVLLAIHRRDARRRHVLGEVREVALVGERPHECLARHRRLVVGEVYE